MQVRFAFVLLVVALALGCSKKDKDAHFTPTQSLTPAGTDIAADAPVKLTADRLKPIIAAVGGEGLIPSNLAIEFSVPVIEQSAVGQPVPTETVFKMTPVVEGTLRFLSTTSLTFTPKKPFDVGTSYSASLEAVSSRDGILNAPAGETWQTQFTTPAFSLARVSQSVIDLKTNRANVVMTFTAPPLFRNLNRFFSWTLVDGGRSVPLRDVTYKNGNGDHQIQAVLQDPAIRNGVRVKVAWIEGIPMAGRESVVAPQGEEEVELTVGEPVNIIALQRKEGVNGHYLEVVCDDEANKSDKRYYYDQETHDDYRISRRCELTDADAYESIFLSPPVKFSVTPSNMGFRIFGDFKRGTYTVRVAAGARSVDGGVVPSDYERTISIPARSPSVSFVSKGRYLPRNAWKNLPISHLNLTDVELTIRHVPPENLIFWVSDSSEQADQRKSNVVLKTKLALNGKPDEATTSWIDLATLLPDSGRGVYQITVNANGKSDSSRILLTDLNLIAKRAMPPEGQAWGAAVWVWAIDMHTTKPRSGVEIKLVRPSGQAVAVCKTDGDGACKLDVPSPGIDPAIPFAIVATDGDDLTYLKYSDLKVESGAAVQGEAYSSVRAYRASVYSDRGVYRPGETAHVAAVVRDKEFIAPPKGMPVELHIYDPRGKELTKAVLETNVAGMVVRDVPFADYAATGKYRVVLEAGKQTIGEYAFNIEEFVPERMAVVAAPVRAAYGVGDVPLFKIDAKYLFGGSAEGSKVELNCELTPAAFRPQQNGNFEYGIWHADDKPERALTLGTVTGLLDKNGAAELACPALSGERVGAGAIVARAAVFESGSGRTTVARTEAKLHPETFYIGLDSGTKKAELGKPIQISGIIVDWEGKAVTKKQTVTLDLLRLQAEYNWDYGDDGSHYIRQLRPLREGSVKAEVVNGKFTATLTPAQNGEGFVVRARVGRAQTDLRLEGQSYWYYWGESRVDQTPRPLKPTDLPLELPKTIVVGKEVVVHIKVPYKGRMLMTVETDRVVLWEWVEGKPGPLEWSFKLKEFAPNVYVSAFLVKDPHLHSAEAFLPDRAFAVRSVTVDPVDFRESLRLEVPKEVRSNSKLDVMVFVEKPSEELFVTVAAVDEGILSLTGFQNPDPFPTVFNARALGLETFETIGWALILPPGEPNASGGDAGGDPARVQAVKPVALWSGLLKMPKDGKLKVSFDVPQYRGSLRIMAVAASSKKMASAAAAVPVRDPLVVQTTLPRFFIAGDQAQIPVFITNLSGKTRDVKVSMQAEDLALPGMAYDDGAPKPLNIIGPAEKSVKLENNKSGTVVFEAVALKQIGGAKLRVTVKAGDLISKEELDVPFAPSAPKTRELKRVELAAGKTDLRPLMQGWVPTTEQSTFWVTTNPYGESFDHLSYVIRYPYGCIEQTTSSLRPLLAVRNLLPNLDPTLVKEGTIERMIMAGVNRILSMQTPSGGFSYWPGSNEPTYWGTAYATHALIDAKKLGYDVPQGRVDEALTWLDQELGKINDNGGSRDSYYWLSSSEYYMQYVLAVGGRGRKARLQKLTENAAAKMSGPDTERMYVLKAALYLSGDRRYERDLKTLDLSSLTEERINDWTFYSDRRRRGFILSVFQDLFGRDAVGEPLAEIVANGLRNRASHWFSTQEIVWGVTALGRWVQAGSSQFSEPTLMANTKLRKPIVSETKDKSKPQPKDRSWFLARASEYKTLSLDIAKKDAGKLFLLISSEGVKPNTAWNLGGEGIRLDRTYRDAAGKVIVPETGIALGQMVYVDLTLSNTTGDSIQNIVLVDRIPAGWEIENPRLGRGSGIDWADDLWSVDYMNVRDDRIEVFGKLPPKKDVHIVYAVRAVTAGKFTIPPSEAEAMYDSRIWARVAGHRIDVSGPWSAYLQ